MFEQADEGRARCNGRVKLCSRWPPNTAYDPYASKPFRCSVSASICTWKVVVSGASRSLSLDCESHQLSPA
jgi:hypothetical protein